LARARGVYVALAVAASGWYVAILVGVREVRPGILETVEGLLLGVLGGHILAPAWMAYVAQLKGGGDTGWERWAPLLGGPTRPLPAYLRYKVLAVGVFFGAWLLDVVLGLVLRPVAVHLQWPWSRIPEQPDLPTYSMASSFIVFMAVLVVTVCVIVLRNGKLPGWRS